MSAGFGDWLLGCLVGRGWSQAELARRAGLSEAQVSRLVTGARAPGLAACRGLSRALRLPFEYVCARAGMTSLAPGQDAAALELGELSRRLAPADRELLLAVARAVAASRPRPRGRI